MFATVSEHAGEAPPTETGPLAEYLSVFPYRSVRWDARRQLWAVWETDPNTGEEWRVELVFYYDAPPHIDGSPRTPEQVADLVARSHPSVFKAYRPFDYPFVRQRLRERYEFQRLGPTRYQQQHEDRNRRLERRVVRQAASEAAARLAEIRRYLPVIAELQEGRTLGDAMVSKQPQFTGAELSPKGG